MKNNDIRKAVESNELDKMNGSALDLMFSSLRPIKKQNIPKDAA